VSLRVDFFEETATVLVDSRLCPERQSVLHEPISQSSPDGAGGLIASEWKDSVHPLQVFTHASVVCCKKGADSGKNIDPFTK
jgi:hypothetical protein